VIIQKRLLLAFIFIMAWPISATLAKNTEPLAPPVKEIQQDGLNLLVQQYLLSNDTKQSEQLLKEVQRHEQTSLEKLETFIKEGKLYPPEPFTGSLHRELEVRGYEMNYALYVPETYNPKSAYPLIVCLHGAGFVGDSYLDRWKSRLGDNAILVCPTIGNGAWWSPQGEALVMSTINAIGSQYHIDPDKIFLTGMSNGGIGVHLIGMFHANRFAAVSPMASGIPEEVFPFLKNFSFSGIYIIHGKHDEVMPVTLSRDISQYLKKTGIPHIYREHEKKHPMAGGHFFPREELPDLVRWFQKQHRISDPADLVLVADKIHLSPFYWAEINEVLGPVADVQKSLFNNEEVELVKQGAFANLTAKIEGNRITVETERVKKFTLFFNNKLIDFSNIIMVFVDGQKRFEGRLTESVEFLLKEAKRRQDGTSFYSASVTIDLADR